MAYIRSNLWSNRAQASAIAVVLLDRMVTIVMDNTNKMITIIKDKMVTIIKDNTNIRPTHLSMQTAL